MKPPKCWLTGYTDNDSNNHKNYNDNQSKDCNNESNANTSNFGEGDTFRHYMARKIHLQRNQFGLRLPPKPSSSSIHSTSIGSVIEKEDHKLTSNLPCLNVEIAHEIHSEKNNSIKNSHIDIRKNKKIHERNVTFHPLTAIREENDNRFFDDDNDDDDNGDLPPQNDSSCGENSIDSGDGMQGLLQRLKQQHKAQRLERKRKRKDSIRTNQISSQIKIKNEKEYCKHYDDDKIKCQNDNNTRNKDRDDSSNDEEFEKEVYPQHGNEDINVPVDISDNDTNEVNVNLKDRPDLFFLGVVVLVNGFTEPCGNTLMRMLHAHGGDMEKYETTRVTHIIASELSHAKRLIYQKQRNPIPVVKPQWIVDSVSTHRKIPIYNYLLLQRGVTSNDGDGKIPSLDSFFTLRTQTNLSHDKNTNDDDLGKIQKIHSNCQPDKFNGKELPETDRDSSKGNSSLLSSNQQKCNHHAPLLPNDVSKITNNYSSKIRNNFKNSQSIIDISSSEIINCADNSIVDDDHEVVPPIHEGNSHQTNYQNDAKIEQSAFSKEIYDLNDIQSKKYHSFDDHQIEGDKIPPDIEKQDHKIQQNKNTTSSGCKNTSDIDTKNSPKMNCNDVPIGNLNVNFKKSSIGPITLPNGVIRTVGNDPNFLESYFRSSRLSFIGSFKQRSSSNSHSLLHSGVDNKRKKNSTRFVFHIDMDCFFAAVALRKYPQYRNKPVAISHAWRSSAEYQQPNYKHNSNIATAQKTMDNKLRNTSTSELSTCNYEARKYGIRKGMFLHRARKLCPDLKILPYDYAGYEEVSKIVSSILESYAEQYGGALEEVSCDESYLEVYFQNNCKDGDNTSSFGKEASPLIERVTSIANDIRCDILDSTECTASVGVGSNKFQAKIATDKIKPNGVYVIQNIQTELSSLKLRDLPGVGYKMERKLNEYGLSYVRDVWDLGKESEAGLCQLLGNSTGKKILNFCKGIDDRPVQAPPRKTIGAECNYGVRFNGPYGVDFMIKGLAEEVEKRMEIVGVTGQRVTLKVKERKEGAGPPGKFNGHGSCHDHSRSSNIISTSATNTRDAQIISRTALKLFQDMDIDSEKIRGMGIIVSKLLEKNESNVYKNDTETSNISSWLGDNHNNSNLTDTSEKTKSPQKKQSDNESQMKQSSRKLVSNERSKLLRKKNLLNKEENTGMKQMSVKRMLKLACVKSGKDLASDKFGGESISLTQLDCLPLDIQLQVVNGDESTNGMAPSLTKKRKISLSKSDKNNDSNKNESHKDENESCTTERNESKQKIDAVDDTIIMFEERNFYTDTLVPLRNWMNGCPEPEQEDFNKLGHFFRILIDEKRLDEVVCLCRLIKKRSDVWGHMYKACLLEETNEYLKKTEGRQLDIEWLGL